MKTWLCLSSAIRISIVACILAVPGYLPAGELTKWSRQLSTEYVHASGVQVASTKFATSSSDGWFAHLSASTEKSNVSQAEASAESWAISSGTQINTRWNVAFGVDKWQGNRAVSQQTINLTLGYSAITWLLDLSFHQRELRIEGQAKNGSTRKHFETFDGGELSFSYFFGDSLSLGFGYTGYQNKPGAVFRALQERPNLVLRLGDHSFGLVSGQARNALTANLSLQLQDWYISVQALTADNYFNNSDHSVFALYFETNLTEKVAVGGEVGVQSSDDSSSSSFVSVAALYTW